jgi:transposase
MRKEGSLMRKMQEYVVKGKKIFVGLEDSKRTWKVCVRNEGMVVDEVSMPAKYEVLRAYFRNKFPECEIRLMYEAGFQGFWLHDLLEEDRIDCIVTPSNKVTCEKDNRVKTDKRDARRLAKNLENGDYVSCHIPDRERREDRQISRTMSQIQKDITATKNRIRRFLDYHGLNYGLKDGEWTDKNYFNLRDLDISRSLKISLAASLNVLEGLLRNKKELSEELHALCEKEKYKYGVTKKMSAPGIGWLTAIRMTLEFGEMSRFKTGKHIASYTGLTSREYLTGDTIRRGRITAQSSELLRSWLIEVAWRAIRKDPVLLEKFQNVWRNSGSKKKAVVAVARKIAVRLWALETTGQPYCIGVIE